MFTLEYNAVEKSFADWGLAEDSASLELGNMVADVFTVRVAGQAIDADPGFPFESLVIIRRDRTWNQVGGVFEGGSIEFQGKRVQFHGAGTPDSEDVSYAFAGPWYDLEESPYQQTIKVYTGDPNNLANVTLTELILFQRVTGPGTTETRNNGQQVHDILQHVLDVYGTQGMAAPYQLGTIEPAVNLYTYPVRDIKCGEAVRKCLQCNPDAVVWFDYTFNPPKVHVTLRASMTPASLTIGDGIKHQVLEIMPRNDLQARGVAIHFKYTHSVNGTNWVETVKQVAETSPGVAGPESGRRVLVQTIDLQGFSRNDVTGELVCSAITNTRDWWAKYVPDLVSNKIRNFTLQAATVKDASGNPVSLVTYPRTLDDGTIAPWMKVGGNAVISQQVTIEAEATFDQYDAETGGRLLTKWNKRTLVARVTITNGVTGGYSETASAIDAEAVPAGLAQAIYDALKVLQHEGRVQLVEQDIAAGGIGMGNVLNLLGGRVEWETMAAPVQTIQRAYGRGRTLITFGPARHLGAADLTQLFLMNRNRVVLWNPLTQATAKASVAGSVALGKNAPKENSNTALQERQMFAVAMLADGTNKVMARLDAENSRIVLGKVADDGTAVAGAAVSVALGDCDGKPLWIQEMPICIGGVTKYIRLLCTEPYTK